MVARCGLRVAWLDLLNFGTRTPHRVTRTAYSVTRNPQRLNAFTAIRTILKIRIQRFAAMPALLSMAFGCRSESSSGFRRNSLTAVAQDKGLTLFDSEYRNKEQAEIMVYAPLVGLV